MITDADIEYRPRPTMNLEERRRADRDLAAHRREARFDFVRESQEAAEADAEYRRTKATVYLERRAAGATAKDAEVEADAKAADAKCRRDIAASLARAAQMRIAEVERDAVTVRDLHASSERIDGVAA